MANPTISTIPSRDQALAALAVLLDYATGMRTDAAVFTQDNLPPDATSRDAFLRRHRDRLRSRTPGWTRTGKVRAVTAEAWARDVAAETNRPRAVRQAPPVPAFEIDELDARLGILSRVPQ